MRFTIYHQIHRRVPARSRSIIDPFSLIACQRIFFFLKSFHIQDTLLLTAWEVSTKTINYGYILRVPVRNVKGNAVQIRLLSTSFTEIANTRIECSDLLVEINP